MRIFLTCGYILQSVAVMKVVSFEAASLGLQIAVLLAEMTLAGCFIVFVARSRAALIYIPSEKLHYSDVMYNVLCHAVIIQQKCIRNLKASG